MLRISAPLLLVLSTAAWGAGVQLPAVAAQPSLGKANPLRVRVTVTASGIWVKPRGDGAPKQVTVLDDFELAAADRRGTVITALHAALQPGAGSEAVKDGSDGRVELWIDRAAHVDLMTVVLNTVGPLAPQVAIGVKTPQGERTVEVILPQDLSSADALLTFHLDDDHLEITSIAGAVQSPQRVLKRSVANVRSTVAAFVKAQAKGRQARRAVLGAWECVDATGKRLDEKECWHGRVVFSGSDHTVWGDVMSLCAAAQALNPDVVFALI